MYLSEMLFEGYFCKRKTVTDRENTLQTVRLAHTFTKTVTFLKMGGYKPFFMKN